MRSKPQPAEPSPDQMCERLWTLPNQRRRRMMKCAKDSGHYRAGPFSWRCPGRIRCPYSDGFRETRSDQKGNHNRKKSKLETTISCDPFYFNRRWNLPNSTCLEFFTGDAVVRGILAHADNLTGPPLPCRIGSRSPAVDKLC